MKTNKKLTAMAAMAAACVATHALGQTAYVRPAYQFPPPPEGSERQGIQVGDSPFYAAPVLGVGAGRDDNLFLSNTNETSTPFYVINPGLRLNARDANKVFQLGYNIQAGHYSDSEDDDYVDHTLRAQFDVAFDRRNFLRLGYEYLRGHDPRGHTDRPPAGEPDRFSHSVPSLTYAFGTPGAAGRLEAYASGARKRYLNNRETTAASDRDAPEVGGVFYWRVAPKTHALFEARRTELDYKSQASNLSGSEVRYYGGLSWEATAATTGTIKLGRLEKRFDRGHPDYSDLGWEAVVSWLPRSYSRLDLYGARTPIESTGLGSFILAQVAGVSWNHAWSSTLSTALDARYQKDYYQDFPRTDETVAVGLKVGYRIRRWLTLGFEYTHTQRDSNQRVYEYDKNFYLLSAAASM